MSATYTKEVPTVSTVNPNAGDLGRPLRTIEIVPNEIPVPVPAPEFEPAHEPTWQPEPEPIEVER
jgi:hypothetical protein